MGSPSRPSASSAHADRNPSREILPVRKKRVNRKKTPAEKRAAAIRKAQNEEKAQLLADELENYYVKEEKTVEDIAEKTGYKVEYIRRVLKSTGVKRGRSREITAYNAMISHKAKELNKDVPDGEAKFSATYIANKVKEDPSFAQMTPAEEKEAIEALSEKRKAEKIGVRLSKKGVTLEGLHAMGIIGETLHTVGAHGGLAGWSIVVKSHVTDSFIASYAGTEGAPEFIKETMGISMEELLLLYELWECSRTNRPRTKNLPTLQKYCAKIIIDGLHAIVEDQEVTMKYKQYERQICLKHKVKLQNWPNGIVFDTPHQVGSIENIETLRDALVSGECKWVKIKPQEYKELQKKLAEEGPGEPRKPRSDKGGKRSRLDDDGEGERAPTGRPAKRRAGVEKPVAVAALKAKVTKQLPEAMRKYKSKAFIEDSDDDDTEEEGAGGQDGDSEDGGEEQGVGEEEE